MATQQLSDRPYVFLSYASRDRERAQRLAAVLEAAGVRVWVDREAIAGGTSWGSEIVEGIERCAALVILCSEAALGSRNVRQEIQLAWRYERAYLPVLLEPVEFPQQVQYFLEGWQWVDVLDRPEAEWRPALLKALARLGVQAADPAPAAAPAPAGPSRTAVVDAAPARAGEEPGERSSPFVGREQERRALRAALDDALAGRGRIALLAGEPGIGKTRLAQELAREAAQRGAAVLWGRCWEGEGAPVFWPWVQVLRAAVRASGAEALGSAMTSGAAEIAQLVPEVRGIVPELAPSAPAEPEQARFRLFDGVTSFLCALSGQRPLVVALDDLHWADKPSLLLLQFLARELAGVRVLVVGTYRDVDLDRQHPLAEVLTTLRREPAYERVLVRGLPPEDVTALVAARLGHELDPPMHGLARRLHQETEGNPFFIDEILRHLEETGALRRRDGRWVAAGAGGQQLGIPEGVREVIGRRLSRLSADTNQLLTVAAVAGREFRFGLLELLTSHGDERLLELLDEALASRLIEETAAAGEYRFTHALIQETLVRELSTTRRVRLHGRVAEALERLHGRQAERRAAELAYHFAESATVAHAHAEKAVAYTRLAGEHAETATAWEDAARQYEHCLTLAADVEGSLGVDEPALLTAIGRCRRYTAEWRAAWRSLMRAIALYRERGDGVGMARATLEAMPIAAPAERRIALAEEALAALGDRDPYLAASLLVSRAQHGHQDEAAERAAARAADLAAAHGFEDVRARLAQRAAGRAADEMRFDDAYRLYRAAYDTLIRLGRPAEATNTLIDLGSLPLATGPLDAGVELAKESLARARKVHVRWSEQNIVVPLAAVLLARCEFERCEALLGEIEGDIYWVDMLRTARAELQGDLAEALALMPAPERSGGFPTFIAPILGARARVRLNTGDLDGAREEVRAWAAVLDDVPRTGVVPVGRMLVLTEIDEALPALGEEAHVRIAYEDLCRWSALRFAMWSGRGLDHHRGALARRLGLPDEAEDHYRGGLAWAERERLPVEQGRCLQGLAELAAGRGRPDEALAHLGRAAEIFERHGIALYLRRVREQRARLRTA